MGKEIKKLDNSEIDKVSGGNVDLKLRHGPCDPVVDRMCFCKKCKKAFNAKDFPWTPLSVTWKRNPLCPECKQKEREETKVEQSDNDITKLNNLT